MGIAHVFLITDPFFDSIKALSLQWRDLLFVCSIKSLFNSSATTLLINSEPLSEWKLKIINGNWLKSLFNAGSKYLSLIKGTQTTISHWITSSTALI